MIIYDSDDSVDPDDHADHDDPSETTLGLLWDHSAIFIGSLWDHAFLFSLGFLLSERTSGVSLVIFTTYSGSENLTRDIINNVNYNLN